jgi:ATP synthase protein I
MGTQQHLKDEVRRQCRQLQRAEREKRSVLSEAMYVGTLGLQLVLPVIGGAYLGRWLDGMSTEYSTSWTISLILVGLFVGIVNVYLSVRDRT